MENVNIKKSVIFCAFSLNANNIFCDSSLCNIWCNNQGIRIEEDPFIKTIIKNDKLKIEDSNESLIDFEKKIFNEKLLNYFKDCKDHKKGVLTEINYNNNFYYFFSTNDLKVEDFFTSPTPTDREVFNDFFSKREFCKKINVEVKNGKLTKNDEIYTPNFDQNPTRGLGQNPLGKTPTGGQGQETDGKKNKQNNIGKEPRNEKERSNYGSKKSTTNEYNGLGKFDNKGFNGFPDNYQFNMPNQQYGFDNGNSSKNNHEYNDLPQSASSNKYMYDYGNQYEFTAKGKSKKEGDCEKFSNEGYWNNKNDFENNNMIPETDQEMDQEMK